jgi:N-acylneuraminate cytidylyltransferase
MPFFTEGYEGFDVNHPADWRLAEAIVQSGQATLPAVSQAPYSYRDSL